MKKLSLSIALTLLVAGCATSQTGAAGSDLGTPRQYQGPPPSEQVILTIDVPEGWTRQQKGVYAKPGAIESLISNKDLKAAIIVGVLPTEQASPADGAAIFALKLALQGAEVSEVNVANDGSQASFTWTAAAQGLAGKVNLRIFPEKKQLMALFMGNWIAASDASALPAFDAMAASAKIK
jgi:hypothetical protein